MHSRRIISTVTVLAGAMYLSSGIAQGSAVPNLILTENSSSSLTATLNGSSISVTFDGLDQWTINFTGLINNVSGSGIWMEPTGVNMANIVTTDSSSDTFSIHSDAGTEIQGMANGTIDTTTFKTDGGAGSMTVTFIDNGDSPSSVPDATSTLPLLSLALAGLGIFAKRRKA